MGLWLNQLDEPSKFSRVESKKICIDYLKTHFNNTLIPIDIQFQNYVFDTRVKTNDLWKYRLSPEANVVHTVCRIVFDKRKTPPHYKDRLIRCMEQSNSDELLKAFNMTLFKFGKKIFNKITEAMSPAFEDEKPINPFDFWSGANFKLKIRKVDGFWNYDKSEFEAPAALNQDDAVIKETWAKQYPLKPFLETANFKSYDDLKEKLNRVISGSKNTETASDIDLPPASGVAATMATTSVKSNEASSVDEDDDTLSYFSKLAEDE